jgi:hypothetical protein
MLAGCVTVTLPPDVIPLMYLESLQGKEAPAIRRVEVEGRTWTLARLGLTLLDLETRMAFIGLIATGARNGRWPDFETLRVAGVTWRASTLGGNLLLEAQGDHASPVRTALLTPDGYMSIEEELVPLFESMNAILERRRWPFPPPVVPVVEHRTSD